MCVAGGIEWSREKALNSLSSSSVHTVLLEFNSNAPLFLLLDLFTNNRPHPRICLPLWTAYYGGFNRISKFRTWFAKLRLRDLSRGWVLELRALDTGGTDLVLLHIPDRLVSGVYIRANPLILIWLTNIFTTSANYWFVDTNNWNKSLLIFRYCKHNLVSERFGQFTLHADITCRLKYLISTFYFFYFTYIRAFLSVLHTRKC